MCIESCFYEGEYHENIGSGISFVHDPITFCLICLQSVHNNVL